jgi:hypothetical protein
VYDVKQVHDPLLHFLEEISGVSRNSVNKIIKAIRIRIAEICEHSNLFGPGGVEID